MRQIFLLTFVLTVLIGCATSQGGKQILFSS